MKRDEMEAGIAAALDGDTSATADFVKALQAEDDERLKLNDPLAWIESKRDYKHWPFDVRITYNEARAVLRWSIHIAIRMHIPERLPLEWCRDVTISAHTLQAMPETPFLQMWDREVFGIVWTALQALAVRK